MKEIGQNAALASLEQHLVPDPFLIDGRTEKQRLSFLCDFASLINFYDSTNTVNGNWRPFLLKDPVFLLAHISTTDYRRLHHVYVRTCANIQRNITTGTSKDNTIFFNLLFEQLTDVFLRLERWTYYMQLSNEEYDLKRYVLTQVKDNFSSLLWAVLGLQNNMAATRVAGKTKMVRQNVYDAFDDDLWMKYSGRQPYQDVLQIKTQDSIAVTVQQEDAPALVPGNAELLAIYFASLRNAGDSLFRFFHTIIRHSQEEYERVKIRKSRYPDTTLLRAFTDLMKVHEAQLNGISGKHLRFYYSDILKQSELPAVPDSVFICTVLAKNPAAFGLPAQTQFNAGTDAQKEPIVFSSLESVSLNSAVVANAYTLSVAGNALTYQQAASPSVIRKAENGAVQSWATFGGAPSEAAVSTGFAFGSPMLLLLEGQRTITITLNFAALVDASLFSNANYALSTQKAWLPVTPTGFPVGTMNVQQLTFEIVLPPSAASIEAFAVAPDGLNSTLPMLQVLFTSAAGIATPPDVVSLTIDVSVQGVASLQLFNDYGALSTKAPFQVFGPVPDANSNFMIGSAEIFSKPVTALTLEIDWDNLPLPKQINTFNTYYAAYNQYILSNGLITENTGSTNPPQTPPAGPNESKLKNAVNTATAAVVKAIPYAVNTAAHIAYVTVAGAIVGAVKLAKGLWNGAKKTGTAIRNLLSKKSAATYTPGAGGSPYAAQDNTGLVLAYFNNYCFQVGFSSLNDHQWSPVAIAFENDASTLTPPAGSGQTLFAVNAADNTLAAKTFFAYQPSATAPALPADPTLQDDLATPLAYTNTSASGFLRMTLTAPGYGFGASLYGAVVAYVAMQNALVVSKKEDPSLLKAVPNIPFAPKASAVSATYSASQTYALSAAPGTYPLQWFYYTPFTNYTAYDNTPGTTFNGNVLNTFAGTAAISSGLPAFPAMKYTGVLFIELANLLPDNYLNLFFQLAASYGATDSTTAPDYFYLTQNGWATMQLTEDGTNGFCCSGIVQVNIPGDISNQTPWRAGENYWLAIGVKDNSAAYSQTVLLSTNGILLQRTGSNYLTDTTAPKIAAQAITKPMVAIPQIATIVQPFPSFGGKPAEDQIQMNQRVSNRIKTKDRAASREDFFRLITGEFPDIYYTKSIYNADLNTVTVYVVKKYADASEANAFTPLVDKCEEEHILDFLSKRMSLFPSIVVSDFSFCMVQVTATVVMENGYVPQAVEDNVNAALKIYLSPWITSTVAQLAIDEGINEAAVAAFIGTVPGVKSVSSVQVAFSPVPAGAQTPAGKTLQQNIIKADPGYLFVTAAAHTITATAA